MTAHTTTQGSLGEAGRTDNERAIKCDCIEEVNKYLVEHNTEISLPLIGRQQPFIQTNKLNEKKRGKPALMFATYCPFCGTKYPDDRPADAAEGAK